jgi:hypothetical protein
LGVGGDGGGHGFSRHCMALSSQDAELGQSILTARHAGVLGVMMFAPEYCSCVALDQTYALGFTSLLPVQS